MVFLRDGFIMGDRGAPGKYFLCTGAAFVSMEGGKTEIFETGCQEAFSPVSITVKLKKGFTGRLPKKNGRGLKNNQRIQEETNMKKWLSVLCLVLAVCLAASACAASVVMPDTPQMLKELVGGKSFIVDKVGMGSTGEDEDTKYTVTLALAEYKWFDAATVEALQVGDIVRISPTEGFMIMELTKNEDGDVIAKGGDGEAYLFSKREDGRCLLMTEFNYPIWANLFMMEVPIEKDIKFIDWTGEEPVEKGYDELIELLVIEDANIAPYNTTVTFDENGNMVEFKYVSSPYN